MSTFIEKPYLEPTRGIGMNQPGALNPGAQPTVPPRAPAASMMKSGAPASPGGAATPPPAGQTTPPAGGNQEVLASDPFSYQALQQLQQSGGGGMNLSWITPDKWAAMTPQQRWQIMDSAGGLPNEIQTQYGIRPTQDAVTAYTAQFGAPSGQLTVSYGPPTLYGHSYQEWAIDPSKVVQLPDGRYVFDASNVNQQVVSQWANADQHSGLDLNPAKGVGFVLGAGLLGDLGFGLNGGTANIPNIADTITGGLNNTIDTSLLPNVTAPSTIPMATDPVIPEMPPVAPPGGGGPPPASTVDIPGQMPNVTAPTTATMNPAPNITNPGSLADRITNSLTHDPLRTIGAGATIASVAGRKPPTLPPAATNTQNNNTTLNNQATTTLQNNGQPTPSQIQVIDATLAQTRTRALEGIEQASVNAGMGGTNSMVTQDKIRALDEQLATMRVTMIQQQADQNVMEALQELGTTNSAELTLAQMNLQQDEIAMARATSIMESLGWLFGSA